MIPAVLLATLLFSHWEIPVLSTALMIPALGLAVLRDRSFLEPGWKALLAFGALVGLGMLGFTRHPLFDAGKDVWYASKPLVEVAFGLWVVRRLGALRVLWVFLVGAAVVSVDHVVRILGALPEYLMNGTNENRVQFGAGSFLSLLALVVLVDPPLRRAIARQGRHALGGLLAIAVLGAVSLALSRSRTLGVMAAVFVLLQVGVWLGRNRLRRIAAGAAVVGALGLAWIVRTPSTGLEESQSFVEKAVEEVAIGEYANDEDVAQHWRGFESFLALQQFDSFGPVQKVLGGGFGQNVPLDMVRSLAEEQFDEIPLLHNGYLYVLIKVGLVGLLVFFAALWALWRLVAPPRPVAAEGEGSMRLLGGWAVLCIALSTAVITGPFNKTELLPVTILCGVLGGAACAGWRELLHPGEPSVTGLGSDPAADGAPAPEAT